MQSWEQQALEAAVWTQEKSGTFDSISLLSQWSQGEKGPRGKRPRGKKGQEIKEWLNKQRQSSKKEGMEVGNARRTTVHLLLRQQLIWEKNSRASMNRPHTPYSQTVRYDPVSHKGRQQEANGKPISHLLTWSNTQTENSMINLRNNQQSWIIAPPMHPININNSKNFLGPYGM